MSDNDKQALIDGTATIPFRITILGETESENVVLTEEDIANITYEDYRYVDTATICIGQFVAREISGTVITTNLTTTMENKEIKVEIGVKTDSTTTYYSLGNFLVTLPENDDVDDTLDFDAMDYTKKFNQEFDASGLIFPCTALQLAQYCCNKCGVELATTTFANSTFTVPNNQYETGDTYRKVMQDIGKLAYSWVRIGWDNKCYIDFSIPSTTVDDDNKITPYNYYDLTIQNEKFGPVNRVVIGMTDVEGENAYIEDGSSIAANGVCELQIMDCNITYTPELRQQAITSASRLFGLTFTPVEINTTGHPWLLGNELIEIEKTDGTKITTIPFDRTIEYAGHIKTKLVASADTKTETEYKNTGTLETAVKQTRIIVDKQNQTITQVVENVEEYDSRITQVEQDMDSITQEVNQTINVTREVTNIGSVTTEDNAYPGTIVELSIHGDVVPYYPSTDRYPSTDFYMKPSDYKLYIDYTEDDIDKTDTIPLPFDYLTFLNDVYDEFIIDINGNAKKIKRIGFTNSGEKYILPNEEIIDYGHLTVELHEGVNTLYMNYYSPTIYLKYAIINDYTDMFATKVELNSSIEQTSNNIMLTVNGSLDTLDEKLSAQLELKVDTENLISEINASADVINLTGNRIIINSENFKVTEDGTITANNAKLSGTFQRFEPYSELLSVDITGPRIQFYDYQENNGLTGTIGSTIRPDTNRTSINLYAPPGGIIDIGYDTGDDEHHINSIISFDASEPDSTPYIRNTASGTLFNDGSGNGITVEHGLIKNWNMPQLWTGNFWYGNVHIYVDRGLITNVTSTNSLSTNTMSVLNENLNNSIGGVETSIEKVKNINYNKPDTIHNKPILTI